MIELLQNDKVFFKTNGYIIKNSLFKNSEFDKLSNDFKSELQSILSERKHINLGGYKSGNLNIYPGRYAHEILSKLNSINFKNYFEFLVDEKFDNYEIIYGGNLNFINSKKQFFHTDGNWNPRMIVLNIATSEINMKNGPLELVEKSHLKRMNYLKFILRSSSFKKKKITLNKGDILIREHRLWHRGTKNFSNEHREMIGIAFLSNNNKKANKILEKKIYLHPNIFGNSKKEKFKEFIFLKLKFLLFFYKIFLSIRKKI